METAKEKKLQMQKRAREKLPFGVCKLTKRSYNEGKCASETDEQKHAKLRASDEKQARQKETRRME